MAPDELDARILLVEQRLIDREARLRQGATALGDHVHDALQPRRFVKPALVVAGIAALLWLRPRRAAAAQASPAKPLAATAGLAVLLRGVPWMRVISITWPLLPARWRGNVSPTAAGGLAALGIPVLERLLRTPRDTAPLAAMPEVDLARLAGRWFLVGEIPAAGMAEPRQPPELGLLPRDDGQFDLLQRRIDRHGTHGQQALVRTVPGSNGARLQVNHLPALLQALPWGWEDLRVLHVDAGYDEALIGSPARDVLWLLSRRPEMAAPRRQALTDIARERGFDVERLHAIVPA